MPSYTKPNKAVSCKLQPAAWYTTGKSESVKVSIYSFSSHIYVVDEYCPVLHISTIRLLPLVNQSSLVISGMLHNGEHWN